MNEDILKPYSGLALSGPPIGFQGTGGAGQGYLERFAHWAVNTPDAIAVRENDSGRQYSYAEAQHEIEKMRGQFCELGVQPGDRVLLILPLGAEFVFAFYALTSLQVVSVVLSPNLTSWELANCLRKLAPRGIITESRQLDTHGKAFRELQALRFVFSVDAPASGSGLVVRTCADLHAAPMPLKPLGRANPVISCHETYKGFSSPVSVLHRYHDYSHSISGMGDSMPHPLLPGEVVLGWLPLYSVYSLTMSVLLTLSYGATLLLVEKMRSNFLELFSSSQARVVPMIPSMLPLLLRQVEGKTVPPLHPHLYLCSGGSKLGQGIRERVEAALGLTLCEGYGTTETLPITGNFPGLSRPGSIGRSLVAANRIAILDVHGQELPPGERNIGEIAVRGPSVAEGFVDDPQHAAHFFRDGWFHTGDLGWRDEDGYFYFVGRRISITKISAQMVDLREVEQILVSHPGVNRARTIVHADEGECEQLIASVMQQTGQIVDAGMLRAHCRKYLSPHKIPKRFNIYPMPAPTARVLN
ncbi:long-chain fatty acid--CoA ligase [soil metagenome]